MQRGTTIRAPHGDRLEALAIVLERKEQDRLAEEMTALARRERTEPPAFLRYRPVFADLADDERFAGAFRRALESLHTRGAAATVADLA